MSDEADRLQQSWIVNAAAWTEAVRERRIESRRLVTDAAILEAILACEPRHVLDLGCGEGWLARALSARGPEVVGVDGSDRLIEAARAARGGRFLTLSYAELAADPERAGTGFDVIVANFSLLDDSPAALLSAMRRVVTKSGTLIVQTVHPVFATGSLPYVDGWRTETFSAIPGQWREPMPWYFRTLSSWAALFGQSGWTIREIREPRLSDAAAPASILFVCVLALPPHRLGREEYK